MAASFFVFALQFFSFGVDSAFKFLMKHLLSFLGYIFAHTPENALKGLCDFVAHFILKFMKRRAAVAYSNVSHCFPDIPEAEMRNIVFESCSRMVEMALFVIASPHISKENLKGRVKVSERVLSELRSHAENPRPIVLMIPHFCMMETITMFPILVDIPTPKVGVFYRPFDSPSLESWVKSSRERFGIELLSRKKGLSAAVRFLKSKGVVAILYDQNSGFNGALSLFFGRYCSTSELPGILVERSKADVGIFYARRTGFWRSEVDGEILSSRTVEEVTFDGNMWLENHLKEDVIARYDWLWLHHRWNVFCYPKTILNTRHSNSRSIVEYSLRRMGIDEVPRLSRIYVNSPASFSDTLAFLPLVKLLRKSRQDCTVTLICPKDFSGAVDMFGIADSVMAAPPETAAKSEKRAFYKLVAKRYPDLYLSLRDSKFDDAMSALVNVQFSFAISYGRARKNFRHVVAIDAASAAEHVAREQEFFLRSLGLEGESDYSPLCLPGISHKPNAGEFEIALILDGAGARNWNAKKWGELIRILSSEIDGVKFALFGRPEDDIAAFEISAIDCPADIVSYAGRLDARGFARRVLSSSAAIGCDCDFTRISNALGIPTAVIYGPTNPLRDGLVFDAPKCEILPPQAPAQGGVDIDSLPADMVASQFLKMVFNKERELKHD